MQWKTGRGKRAILLAMCQFIGILRAVFGPLLLITVLALTTLPSLAQQQEVTGDAYGQLGGGGGGNRVDPGDAGPDQYAVAAENLSMLSETQLSLERVTKRLVELIAYAPNMVGDIHALLVRQSPTGEAVYFVGIVGWTLAFLLIAYLVEWQIYGRRLVGPWFVALQRPNPQGLVEKLPILSLRAVIGIVGIALSTLLTAALVFGFLDPAGGASQKTVIVVVGAVVASRLTAILWRMVLSPFLSNYRIPCMADDEAKRLFRWLWISMSVSVGLLAFCYWIEDIGATRETHNTLTLLATLLMVAINLSMVLVNRNAITRAILGQCHVETVTWLPRLSALLWAPMVILYFLGASVILTYRLLSGTVSGAPMIVGAYTVLLAVIVAYGLVAFTIARVFRSRKAIVSENQREEIEVIAAGVPDAAKPDAGRPGFVEPGFVEGDPLEGDGDEESGPAMIDRSTPRGTPDTATTGMRDFEALATRTASIFAFGAGIYALLHIWDFDYLLEPGGALDPVQDVIDISLIGYLLYHATRIWIDTRIREEVGDDLDTGPMDGEGGEGNAASRLATLLPLFRNFLLFTIAISVMVMILLEMGINVAPLFAGAGVVGIAIGFGAQTLIRDILSGAFYLVDDAFRKGEYIDIGTVKGTVERISLRSFQLRHHLGALHTIPFGEVTHLTNYSRDWVMVKLPIRVTYDTDVEKVRKLIKKLGAELAEHPIEGPKFLQPLKSQGIYKMEDSAMIMRVKFMTRPGDQWTTRKLVYSRLRELFEGNGVKFAHREVTVRLSEKDMANIPPDQRESVAGAALTAVTVAEEEMLGMPKVVGDDR